jgi:hypothetical protein
MIRLIHLSSNSSKDTWKGEYKDDSSKWDEDLKDLVMFSKKEAGEFYVTLDEYLAYFESTSVSLYAPEFEMINHLSIQQPLGAYTIVKVGISESTEAIFKVTQPFTKREAPGNVRMVINKDVEENKQCPEKLMHIDGTFTENQRSAFLEIPKELSKGTYYLYLEVDNEEVEFCLTVISNTLVKLATISCSDYPDFVHTMVKDYMTFKHNQYKCSPSEPEIQIKNYFGLAIGGYCAHYYTNNSPNKTTYVENFKYQNMTDIEIEDSKNGEMVTVTVEPGEEVLKVSKKKIPYCVVDMSFNNAYLYPDEVLVEQ